MRARGGIWVLRFLIARCQKVGKEWGLRIKWDDGTLASQACCSSGLLSVMLWMVAEASVRLPAKAVLGWLCLNGNLARVKS